jgi:hypothetical protein
MVSSLSEMRDKSLSESSTLRIVIASRYAPKPMGTLG